MKLLIFNSFLVFLLGMTGCSENGKDRPAVKIAVRTEKITERNFQESVSTQGVIEPVVHAALSALVPGRLEELNAEEGDTVTLTRNITAQQPGFDAGEQ